MDIKITPSFRILFALLLLLSQSFLLLSNGFSTNQEESVTDPADLCLTNKVFSFPRGTSTMFLHHIWLEEIYVYFLHIELVTEHACDLNITLTCPDDTTNHIFSARLDWNEGFSTSYDIPIGLHFTGNYSFQFDIDADEVLNLYIKLEKQHQCLENIVPNVATESALYKVMRFQDKMEIRQSVRLKTDWMYRIYIQRVTPIAIQEDSEIKVDFYLESPNNLSYRILNDHTVPFYTEALLCHFGTAYEGLYRVNVKVLSKVEYVNIAYAIVSLHQISDMCPANNTGIVQIVDENHGDSGNTNCTEGCDSSNSTDPNSNLNETSIGDPNNPFGAIYSVPLDATLGIIAGVLIAVCAVIVVVVRSLNKNKQKLDI